MRIVTPSASEKVRRVPEHDPRCAGDMLYRESPRDSHRSPLLVLLDKFHRFRAGFFRKKDFERLSDYRISGHSRRDSEDKVEPRDYRYFVSHSIGNWGIRIIDQALGVSNSHAYQVSSILFRAIAVATRSVTARIRSSSSSKKEGLSQVPNDGVPNG